LNKPSRELFLLIYKYKAKGALRLRSVSLEEHPAFSGI